MSHSKLTLAVLSVAFLAPALVARAQAGGGAGGGNPPDPAQMRQMFQNFMQGTIDPAQMQQMQQMVQQMMSQQQQRVLDQIHEGFRCTDEEWDAFEPQIQRLLKAQINNALSGGGMFGAIVGQLGGARAGGGLAALFPDLSKEVTAAQKELQATLANEEAQPAEIMAKLDAFRAARKQVRDALETVQRDIKRQLNVREEAVLVNLGLLE
jgi:hypothetical protein